MLKVLIQKGLQAQTLDADSVVVYLENGTPISLAALLDGMCLTSHASDPSFNHDLRILGIKRTTVVHHVKQKPISEIVFK